MLSPERRTAGIAVPQLKDSCIITVLLCSIAI